jgi:large subunit ribosomal protein L25
MRYVFIRMLTLDLRSGCLETRKRKSMKQQRELEVTPRVVFGKETKKLRREGKIPGNISGHGRESVGIQFSALAFDHLSHQHGSGSVVSLKGLQSHHTETVLVRHVQRDVVKGKILHVDFTRVGLDERIESRMPLHFVGEAPGVKRSGGVLLHLMEALPVECSVSDILEALDVDISGLAEIDAILYARDVKLPTNYTLTIDPDEPIAKIAATRGELPGTTATVATGTEAPATKSGE